MLAEIKASLAARYDSRAMVFGDTWPDLLLQRNVEDVERALESLVMPRESDTVLDIGTGRRGRYVALLAPSVSMAVGIDLSQASVAIAKRHLDRKVSSGSFGMVVGSADALPFLEAQFTLVICSEVMEYYPLDAVHLLLEEIGRALAPGGRVMVDFPDAEDGVTWEIKESEEREGVAFFVHASELVADVISATGFRIDRTQKADVEIHYLLTRS